MISNRRLYLLTGCIFLLSMICWSVIEERDFVSSFYGSCMLMTLQGQDDRPETDIGKITICILSIISSSFLAIWWWIQVETFVHSHNRESLKIVVPVLLLSSFIITLLVYLYIEDRDLVDSIYGTVMLLTLQGQDDAPETDLGRFLIGILSLFCGFVLTVYVWVILDGGSSPEESNYLLQ